MCLCCSCYDCCSMRGSKKAMPNLERATMRGVLVVDDDYELFYYHLFLFHHSMIYFF